MRAGRVCLRMCPPLAWPVASLCGLAPERQNPEHIVLLFQWLCTYPLTSQGLSHHCHLLLPVSAVPMCPCLWPCPDSGDLYWALLRVLWSCPWSWATLEQQTSLMAHGGRWPLPLLTPPKITIPGLCMSDFPSTPQTRLSGLWGNPVFTVLGSLEL